MLLLALAACGRASSTTDRPDTAATPVEQTAAPVSTPAAPSTPATARRDTTLGACPDTVDAFCFHAERAHDFAADGKPFTVVVDAKGPMPDALRISVRIVRDGTVYYRDDWTSAFYAKYDARPVSADSTRRRTANHLRRLLADSAFRPTRGFLGGASNVGRMLRETIAFDVSVDAERNRLRLGPGDTLPVASAQSPPPTTDSSRVRDLATELRDAPAFRYYAGGEASYAVAWSKKEQRFVVVFSCC